VEEGEGLQSWQDDVGEGGSEGQALDDACVAVVVVESEGERWDEDMDLVGPDDPSATDDLEQDRDAWAAVEVVVMGYGKRGFAALGMIQLHDGV
jgi:hypothetical protein